MKKSKQKLQVSEEKAEKMKSDSGPARGTRTQTKMKANAAAAAVDDARDGGGGGGGGGDHEAEDDNVGEPEKKEAKEKETEIESMRRMLKEASLEFKMKLQYPPLADILFLKCSICREIMLDPVQAPCKDKFCYACIKSKTQCPAHKDLPPIHDWSAFGMKGDCRDAIEVQVPFGNLDVYCPIVPPPSTPHLLSASSSSSSSFGFSSTSSATFSSTFSTLKRSRPRDEEPDARSRKKERSAADLELGDGKRLGSVDTAAAIAPIATATASSASASAAAQPPSPPESPTCAWQGKYLDLHKHVMTECVHRPERCDQCGATVRHTMLEAHVNDTCPNRRILCECGAELEADHLQEHLANRCPNTIISCHVVQSKGEAKSNSKKSSGCGMHLERGALEAHRRDDCPRTVIDCSHSVSGCTARLARAELANHLHNQCRKALRPCPFAAAGCATLVSHDSVDKHERKDARRHMQLLTTELAAHKAVVARLHALMSAAAHTAADAVASAGGAAAATLLSDAMVFRFGGRANRLYPTTDALCLDLNHASVTTSVGGTRRWDVLPRMPSPVLVASAVWLGDRFYVTGSAGSARVDCYMPSPREWVAAPPMPAPRSAHSTVACAGLVFVIGGSSDGGITALASLDIYDPSTQRWFAGAPMSRARQFAAAVDYLGGIVVTGGSNERGIEPTAETCMPLAIVLSSSLASSSSSSSSSSPPSLLSSSAAAAAAAAAVPATAASALAPVSLSSWSWRAFPSPRVARKGAAACVMHRTLLLLGGTKSRSCEEDTVTNEVEYLDEVDGVTRVWRPSELSLPSARTELQAVWVPSRHQLIVCGGVIKEGISRSCWVHSPLDKEKDPKKKWLVLPDLPTPTVAAA